MKNLSLTFCLMIVVFASPVLIQTIDDFVERDGKYYLKFTDEGFSGQVGGKIQGTLRDGIWDGEYILPWSVHINSTLVKKQVSKKLTNS